mmetsp:Transcript_460/g.1324  ORF Transcript_460/g.1324 Transcript_460/m.1324 type:complete len:278 (+) Transcript_460:1472-2305(+)
MNYSVSDAWNTEVLLKRAGSSENGEGMSPGAPLKELRQYAELSEPVAANTILILGMTVSIRRLALTLCDDVISLDVNEAAHELLGPSVQGDLQLRGNWLELPNVLGRTVPLVWGDGIFSTMQSREDAEKLLACIYNTLEPGGAAVLRVVIIPPRIDPTLNYSETLLSRFRVGTVDEPEFSFAMRIFGFLADSYDKSANILDCGVSFDQSRAKVSAGEMTQDELKVMDRTYYTGKNFIPLHGEWESMCTDQGFEVEHLPLTGKDWFDYYTMYRLTKPN